MVPRRRSPRQKKTGVGVGGFSTRTASRNSTILPEMFPEGARAGSLGSQTRKHEKRHAPARSY